MRDDQDIDVLKAKRLTDKNHYSIAECKVFCCNVEALGEAPLHPPDVLDLDQKSVVEHAI